MRLTRIDNTQRHDHRFLEDNDDCAFLGEFTARQGFDFSETNKQIHNLKIPPSKAREQPFKQTYKNRAINFWANKLRLAVPLGSLPNATWIPVPCSKLADHPDHDDRLATVLRTYDSQRILDVRKLVKCNANREAAHNLDGGRPTPESLKEAFEIDTTLQLDGINEVVIFDDVITRGASFKAMTSILREALPKTNFRGIFLARTVHLQEQDPFAGFEEVDLNN
ncbi:phosphoribosyltransferase [Afipia clevelandensis]|uniref:Phosphoribosyltransferase domain-containing protein n=1 Tax=Afipia clevelandensis ATCC 49720 TaxID=883079 RepID=K8P7N4_9BRAD|nr:phosphoribosyltransferase [Afipia clevelandensis]EKS35655.1 hypothetical protein HMPREF9696_01867 [Afipia clevelandensis ATCC 49720]